MSTQKTKTMTTKKNQIIENLVNPLSWEHQPIVREILNEFPVKYLRLMEKLFSPDRLYNDFNKSCTIMCNSEDTIPMFLNIEMYLDDNDLYSCELGDIGLEIESPELKRLCSIFKNEREYEFFKKEINDMIQCHSDYEFTSSIPKEDLDDLFNTYYTYSVYDDFDHKVDIRWSVHGEYIWISFIKGDYKVTFMCPLHSKISKK